MPLSRPLDTDPLHLQCDYGSVLNRMPTAVVIPIANAPHMRTRAAPRIIGAPPKRAASAPSDARMANETAAMTRLTSRGNKMLDISGAVPPNAKLIDETQAACNGRAVRASV